MPTITISHFLNKFLLSKPLTPFLALFASLLCHICRVTILKHAKTTEMVFLRYVFSIAYNSGNLSFVPVVERPRDSLLANFEGRRSNVG